MNAKAYLEQVFDMRKHILRQCRELESCRELALTVPGVSFEGRISRPRETEAPFVKYVCMAMDLEKEIKAESGRIEIVKLEIDRRISTLEDANERLVLRYRYLCCLPWSEIAARLHYSLRYVYKIHGRALRHLENGTPQDT